VLGTISNGFADLQSIGLAEHFKVSFAAHTFGCAKPNPRIFLAACDALGMMPQEVAYVGDDLQLDVHGAQAVGMHGIWMRRNPQSEISRSLQHIRPDAVVANLHELMTTLPKLGA